MLVLILVFFAIYPTTMRLYVYAHHVDEQETTIRKLPTYELSTCGDWAEK